jgi:hypothetical protein
METEKERQKELEGRERKRILVFLKIISWYNAIEGDFHCILYRVYE